MSYTDQYKARFRVAGDILTGIALDNLGVRLVFRCTLGPDGDYVGTANVLLPAHLTFPIDEPTRENT